MDSIIDQKYIEHLFLIIPGIAKRLAQSFYEEVAAKEAVLKKSPTFLAACAEWLDVLAKVQIATEEIREKFQHIIDFFKVIY